MDIQVHEINLLYKSGRGLTMNYKKYVVTFPNSGNKTPPVELFKDEKGTWLHGMNPASEEKDRRIGLIMKAIDAKQL